MVAAVMNALSYYRLQHTDGASIAEWSIGDHKGTGGLGDLGEIVLRLTDHGSQLAAFTDATGALGAFVASGAFASLHNCARPIEVEAALRRAGIHGGGLNLPEPDPIIESEGSDALETAIGTLCRAGYTEDDIIDAVRDSFSEASHA